MTPRTSVRVPVTPIFAKGSGTEEMTPLANVKEVAVPIAAPLALTNEIVPVQEAAVPADEAEAVFTTLSCAVSELATPTGGVFMVCVTVPVVEVLDCDKAMAAVNAKPVSSFERR
jgi:hypothetical protein